MATVGFKGLSLFAVKGTSGQIEKTC